MRIIHIKHFAHRKPITLQEGILFTTNATLRSDERGDKKFRVRQIVDWLAGANNAEI